MAFLLTASFANADASTENHLRTTVLSSSEAAAAGLSAGLAEARMIIANTAPPAGAPIGAPGANDGNPCGTGTAAQTPTPTASPAPPAATTGTTPGDGWWNPNGGTAGKGVLTPLQTTGAPIVGCNPNPTPSATPAPVSGGPVSIAPLPSNGTNPVMTVLNDINSGLTIFSNLINLANNAWNLIARGSPTEQLNFGFISVVPSGFTPDSAWVNEQCSQVGQSFKSCIVDDSGTPHQCFVWGINLAADCSINGAGSYLGKVWFDPKSFNVGYDNHLVVNGTIPEVYNAGTTASPIAAAVVHLEISDSTLFNFRETSSDVLVTAKAMATDPDQGDQHFQMISKSTDGSAPEPISPY